MNDTPIFIVTTMERLKKDMSKLGWLDLGCTSTVGYFHDLTEAQRAVMGNMGDINETCYDYAVIEEMPVGFYQHSINSWFYKFNYDKDEYEAMEKPDFVHEYYVFSRR